MRDTTLPRPPHGQAMGASDATPLRKGQERHPEQTAQEKQNAPRENYAITREIIQSGGL